MERCAPRTRAGAAAAGPPGNTAAPLPEAPSTPSRGVPILLPWAVREASPDAEVVAVPRVADRLVDPSVRSTAPGGRTVDVRLLTPGG